MKDRRVDNRRALFGSVVVQVFETGELIKARGYDISHYGMAIRSKMKLKGGVTYIISTKLNGEVFVADCTLIKNSEFTGGEYKVGFEYTNVSPTHRNVLDRFIRK